MTNDRPYATVPTWVLDHPGLSPRAIRLYAVLDTYDDPQPTREQLAERLGCSVSTVRKALRELAAAGAVVTYRHRVGHSPRYVLQGVRR